MFTIKLLMLGLSSHLNTLLGDAYAIFTCVHPVRERMGGMHRYISKSCAKDICTDGCVLCATELPDDFRITHWHGLNESKALCRYFPVSWH